MAADSVDGMDVLAVERAAREIASAVRRGDGPFFLEARTYRFRAHSMFDAELYRDKSEVEEWKKRDPLLLPGLRALIGAEAFAAIDAEVLQEIADAVTFAEAGTWEPIDELTRDVYTPRQEVARERSAV